MSDGSGRSAGTRADGPGDDATRKVPITPAATPSGGAGRTKGNGSTAAEAKGGVSDDTASRPPLIERIQAKLASATEEHRANASAKSEHTTSTSSQVKTGGGSRTPRRARLRLTRIDPWTVMKTSFLLAIAFGVVTVVAVAMIWSVLDAAGVWDSINTTIQESVGGPDTADLDVENYIGTSRVLGFTVVVAAIDVVLITAIATLTAFLYNMSAALLGGVEVTLSEDQN